MGFWLHIMFVSAQSVRGCAQLTLVRVMLNWMVRMTTRMSKLPSEISVNDLSVYHEMFFNIWNNRKTEKWHTKKNEDWFRAVGQATHHLMDGTVEGIILRKDEENDEGHVDMMRISFLDVVKDLKNRQHLGRHMDKYAYRWGLRNVIILNTR